MAHLTPYVLLQRIIQKAAGRAACASTAPACRTRHCADSSNVPLGRAPANFHECLTRCKQALYTQPRLAKNIPEIRVAGVTAGEPHDLRRRSEARHQLDKITILCEYDGTILTPRPRKDLWIFRCLKPKLPHGDGINSEFIAQPPRQPGRQLCIDPNAHGLSGEHGMPEAATCKAQARRDVVAFQIG